MCSLCPPIQLGREAPGRVHPQERGERLAQLAPSSNELESSLARHSRSSILDGRRLVRQAMPK